MPQMWNEDNPSQEETQKLIEEIKAMINQYNLPVELNEKTGQTRRMAAGCTRCTLCPCMICW